MRTATLTIAIDIDTEDDEEYIGDEYAKELLLEVVADLSDQTLMGYIAITEEEE